MRALSRLPLQVRLGAPLTAPQRGCFERVPVSAPCVGLKLRMVWVCIRSLKFKVL